MEKKGKTKELKPLKTWASDEEDLSFSLNESEEYHITNKGNLRALGPYIDETWWEKGETSIYSFFLPSLAPHHTTDYLRWYCEEHHPEVNFDKEFETWSPGVFARYQERFGYDYEDEVCKMKLDALKDEIKKCGYRLSF